MAKIKVKFDSKEIEIDSRDFYLDNQTIGNVIESLTKHMNESLAKTQESPAVQSNSKGDMDSPHRATELKSDSRDGTSGLGSLEEAEVFEPEFNEPRPIEADEIKSKLMILETNRFFDSPRTVTETVQQLREHGWAASSLDVSKALAKMVCSKEISKNFEEDRAFYFVQNSLVTA